MKRKKLYLVVDLENKELPLCVGTTREVCAFAGISVNTLFSEMYHARRDGRRCKYTSVEIEEDD